VALSVTYSNKSLETSTLTGRRLLLDWHNLHYFVLEVWQELLNDTDLLHWQRMQEYLLDRLNTSVLNQTAELSHWLPIGFLATTTATATSASTTTTTSTATAKTTAFTILFTTTIRHIDMKCVLIAKKTGRLGDA
jgi:hypothetical protein